MSTLIAVYKGSECVGRCDAKCYDAKHSSCDCICGGKNHGAGLQKAQENTKELADKWIEDYKKERNLNDEFEFKIPKQKTDNQLNLF